MKKETFLQLLFAVFVGVLLLEAGIRVRYFHAFNYINSHSIYDHDDDIAIGIDENKNNSKIGLQFYTGEGSSPNISDSTEEEKYPGIAELRQKANDIELLDNYDNPCWETTPEDVPHYKNSYFRRIGGGKLDIVESKYRNLLDMSTDGSVPRRIRCLPYAYLAGVSKCGTSDLFERLLRHPQVYSPMMKEPRWWPRLRPGGTRFGGVRVKHGHPVDVEQYLDLFDGAAIDMQLSKSVLKKDIIIDGSPSTFWDFTYWKLLPNMSNISEPRYTTPHYMKALQPNAKLIIILRNPTDRLYSDYVYTARHTSPEDFHTRAVDTIDAYQKCFDTRGHRSCAFDRDLHLKYFKVRLTIGLYSVYFRDWLSAFPLDQFHVLRTEDYKVDMVNEMNGILQFLNRSLITEEDRDIFLTGAHKNSRRHNRGMLDKTRNIINKFYGPFNSDLAKMLNDKRVLYA